MDKIKGLFRNKSIKTTFSAYLLVCMLSALLFSLFFSEICQLGQERFYEKYQAEYMDFAIDIKIEDPDREDGYSVLSFYKEDISTLFTPLELTVYNVLGFFSVACYPICFIVCVSVTSILFYKKELQKPLEILDQAADHISDHNLDFQIVYEKQDELGKLCVSFEKMRLALRDTYAEMWRQMEERKRLNAAFAHDLRTPLTVLKGQSEMLVKYSSNMSEQKRVEAARMMQRHIERLERYVGTMSALLRLEDIEIQKKDTDLADAVRQMADTADTVCQTKKWTMKKNLPDGARLNLDMPVIMQVYENLLTNAVRYARNGVSVSVHTEGGFFYLNVSDDGKGFSAEALSEAAKPFYKASDEIQGEHFGMGLYICKILCEKHGGYLKLGNENGASVTAVCKG